MRRTLRDLADARKELLEIQQEFVRLQKRIDAVRDCVADSLTRIFGEERPAIAALAEEEFVEKLSGSVAARLGTLPAAKKQIGSSRYVREKEAAATSENSGRTSELLEKSLQTVPTRKDAFNRFARSRVK